MPASVELEWFERAHPGGERRRFGAIRDLVNQVMDAYLHDRRPVPDPDSGSSVPASEE